MVTQILGYKCNEKWCCYIKDSYKYIETHKIMVLSEYIKTHVLRLQLLKTFNICKGREYVHILIVLWIMESW